MFKMTLIAGAAALALTGAALAQKQDGLVNVNVANVIDDIDVDVRDVISDNVVQVPIGIAANVCNVSAALLAEQANAGEATCEATTVTQAFNQQLKQMKKKG